MVDVIFKDEWNTLTLDRSKRLARYERSAVAYTSLAVAQESHRAVEKVLDKSFADYAVLVDLRKAPPRNDDAFEALAVRNVTQFFQRFREVAVLVKSKVGMLQVNRISNSRGAQMSVFDDETAAITHLTR